MKRTIGTLTACAAAAALAIPGGALASGGNDDEIRNAGQCTGGTSSKIKVKTDNGQLEVEFEVDQNQSGDRWKVKLKDNGEVVFKGSEVTRGASGSFSVEKRIANKSGTDTITATARNTDGGERCAAKASI